MIVRLLLLDIFLAHHYLRSEGNFSIVVIDSSNPQRHWKNYTATQMAGALSFTATMVVVWEKRIQTA
jgi:hypothetical protein